MKIIEHIKTHAHERVIQGRYDSMMACLADPEALNELDQSMETWLDVDLRILGPIMADIYQLMQRVCYTKKERDDVNALLTIHQIRVASLVTNAWFGSLGSCVDGHLSQINMEELIEARNLPEPGEAA